MSEYQAANFCQLSYLCLEAGTTMILMQGGGEVSSLVWGSSSRSSALLILLRLVPASEEDESEDESSPSSPSSSSWWVSNPWRRSLTQVWPLTPLYFVLFRFLTNTLSRFVRVILYDVLWPISLAGDPWNSVGRKQSTRNMKHKGMKHKGQY